MLLYSVIFDRALVAPFLIEHQLTKDAPMFKSGKQLWKYFGFPRTFLLWKVSKKAPPLDTCIALINSIDIVAPHVVLLDWSP
ncbi:hypothetical protein L484_022673 [Morus notabilis]|uniref:Uncharacterized protein n=1 Tax=Morus notabilis TaxID=981085 RepID=W9QXX2_9ROSA|nr:hypothetical protein L484_022673 [Morus notabilis]